MLSKGIVRKDVWVRIPPAALDATSRRRGSCARAGELLGVYLGDGTISRGRKRCYRLRIFMDSRYPGIIEEVAAAMREVMPTSVATIQPKPPHHLVEINSYANTSARSSSRPGRRRSSTGSRSSSSAA
jgi:hypothetical protein